MKKIIYACGCFVIKDGTVNNAVRFCVKHQTSFDPSASLDAQETTMAGFSETIVTVSEAQGVVRQRNV